ncbi:MAG: hypothetical protein ACE5LA_03635 [Dehalococcoidales bacterium]
MLEATREEEPEQTCAELKAEPDDATGSFQSVLPSNRCRERGLNVRDI